MMRLSDIIGRISPSTVMVAIALVLFVLVFVGVFIYAYVLLGRDSVERFAAMPLEEHPVAQASKNAMESLEMTPAEPAEMTQ